MTKIALSIFTASLIAVTLNTAAWAEDLLHPETSAYLNKLEQSRKVFLRLSAQSRDTYSYTVRQDSWTGFGNKTTIWVEAGKVRQREIVSWGLSGNITSKQLERSHLQLGEHKRGHPPHTLLKAYDGCRTRLMKYPPERYYISLKTDEQGLLMVCTASPKGCADDCDFGIVISQINFGTEPNGKK